jgi:hypothetical protein
MGPWQPAAQPSKDVLAFQDKVAKSSNEQPEPSPDDSQNAPPPKIITATEPTELIVTDGPPQLASIYNTNLLYVSNTYADVFLDIATQKVYLLLAGRWYMAERKEGPWSYVASDKLPSDFAKIPPESPKANVLASVASTEAAEEAVLDTLIPQTAKVDRSAPGPSVTYDGEPQFEAIQESTVSYAVNTADSVLRVNGGYYCCYQGVWYQSTAAAGPWVVCVSVPGAIYTIPPSCPIYPVRYVYVYNYTPAVVYVGYTPGYMGCYVYGGTVIYGTGFVYRGWWGRYYYPRPVTYGFGVAYNPYTCNWGFRFGAAGPNGWFAFGSRGGAWGRAGFAVGVRWGPNSGWWGAGGYYRHNNITINTGDININRSRNINSNVNISDRSRNIYANRPDNGKGVYTRNRSPSPARADRARPSDRSSSPPDRSSASPNRPSVSDRPNTLPAPSDRNLFADKNGNVVRRGMDGWETRDRANPQRSPAQADRTARQPPANQRQPRPDLDRQLQARDRGQQRARDFQQYRSQTQNPRSNRSSQNVPNRSAAPRGSAGAQRGAR